jgi:hypothetical protein
MAGARRRQVSAREADDIIDEALRSTRPAYRPFRASRIRYQCRCHQALRNPDYNHTEMLKAFELFGSNLLWDHHLDGRTSFAVISLGVIALAHSRQRSRKPRVICAER